MTGDDADDVSVAASRGKELSTSVAGLLIVGGMAFL